VSVTLETPFARRVGIEVPLVCGAMYPCSNPELVAAVSAAGGIGVVQPVSMEFVHGHGLRDGLRMVRGITDRPIGFNATIEKSSRRYEERMRAWLDVALEEGVRFFVTSLGNPRWVVERVRPLGGVVYHDVTEAKWAAKARDGGVDGLIAVNDRAGGHAGPRSAEALLDELAPFGLPVLCAGGIGDGAGFARALAMGYAGVQMGTRFIATPECRASDAYKAAIVAAREDDVVLTKRITGIPVAVLNTPRVQREGLEVGPIAGWLMRNRRTRHAMRGLYALRSAWRLKRASLDGSGRLDFWQAGKSVRDIHAIVPAADVVRECAEAVRGSAAR
jgi:nitronate monooxygenase